MPLDPLQKVPAIFKKEAEHLLTLDNGPHFEDEDKPYVYQVEDVSDGSLKLGIIKGKQLMVYPQEVYGMTYWHDPNGKQPSIFVGIGHVVMNDPNHVGKSKEELIDLGYQFHEKRRDFDPVYPLSHFEDVAKPTPQEATKEPEQAKPVDEPAQQPQEPPKTPSIQEVDE